jgi:hypothetical protein
MYAILADCAIAHLENKGLFSIKMNYLNSRNFRKVPDKYRLFRQIKKYKHNCYKSMPNWHAFCNCNKASWLIGINVKTIAKSVCANN